MFFVFALCLYLIALINQIYNGLKYSTLLQQISTTLPLWLLATEKAPPPILYQSQTYSLQPYFV